MKVVFTDLDGTLLDADTYSCEAARTGLRLLKDREIPLVICTSKTRSEIMYWRRQLGNHHPFISENGGGIYIPEGYFDIPVDHDRTTDGYLVIERGTPYRELTGVLDELAERFPLQGFHDMSPADLAADAGLSLPEARRALTRDYDEPFILHDRARISDLQSAIRDRGLQLVEGGRYFHLTGGQDKGQAVRILAALYEREHGDVVTVGIGDAANDVPMLDAVDHPYLVARPDGTYASDAYPWAGGIGPAGWNRVIRREIRPD